VYSKSAAPADFKIKICDDDRLPQMSRKRAPKPLERVPGRRAHRPPPPQRLGHPPPERPAGAPPNPRRPALKRDVRGGELKDLMEIFPDLPRPARPAARGPVRRIAVRKPR
jgi:hypothetical protein